MEKRANIPGATVVLRGREFVIPPLNFRQLRLLKDDLVTMSSIKLDKIESLADLDAGPLIRVLHAGLEANNPEVTYDEAEALLDMGNVRVWIAALVGASGLSLSEGGGPPGEPIPAP